MEYLIGLDIGTSSVKGVLMTTEGRIAYGTKAVFTYYTSDDGSVEMKPEEYLSACFRATKDLVNAAKGARIKGVCASSASGNLILLDKNCKPITNIISWQDSRVQEEAKEVLERIDKDTLYQQVGWGFDEKTFPLAQLCYLKKHKPELLERCGMVTMSTEYLYYSLTGEWGISASAATPFYLADQVKGEYINSVLDILGISKAKLPPIMQCGTIIGHVHEEMEERSGIPSGTPIILGSFDHPSAARGVGVLEEGDMLLSCGTSWVVFLPIADRNKGIAAKLLVDPFLAPEGSYGVMSSIASLSGRLQLYTNRYIDKSNKAFQILSELARQSEPGANGLCINPLEEPDDNRMNVYDKKDIARAIMEGTVKLLRQRLNDLAEVGIKAQRAVMVGGPSEDPFWIQLIEEMCEIPVKVVHGAFAGAVGAAVIAGIGVGEYENEEEAHVRFDKA